MKPWPLFNVLTEKYRLPEIEAKGLSDFLMKMLHWEPKKRATAKEMLDHYWLKMVPSYNTKMSRQELREYKKVTKRSVSPSKSKSKKD